MLLACADHRALLQLEKEVDILMAQVKAEAPVAESKALLHDIAVTTHRFAGPHASSMRAALSNERCVTLPRSIVAHASLRPLAIRRSSASVSLLYIDIE